MKKNSIFYVNSSQGTGQFARLESASNAIMNEHKVFWISPRVKHPIDGVDYMDSFQEISLKRNSSVNIIFSSESDLIKSYFSLIYLKIKYKRCNIIFMQRIDSLKNYIFNFKKRPSLNIFIRIIFFPFFVFFSSLLINKYIFQTPFALQDYFFKIRLRTFFISLFFFNKKVHILNNNSGTNWNSKFKNNHESNKLIDKNKRTIVYIGNIQYYGKGIDTIFESAKKLDSSIYSFKFVGSIPIQFKEKISDLREFVRNNNLDIDFCGHKDNPHIFLKNENTIFVSASRLDLSPNSVLEALSFKVPILLSNISAHKYIFRNDEFLFSKDDPIDLSLKIVELFENHEKWQKNVKFVENVCNEFNFDWNKEFLKIINI